MKKFALGQFGHPDLILFSFMLFFFCFLGVLVWALSKKNKSHFKKMSELPLGRSVSVERGDSNE